MSITRPVVILLVVGAVLGLFTLGTKHPDALSARSQKEKTAATHDKAGDARAALQEFVALVNQRDAIGLAAMIHRPFYAEKQKFEDDQERQELIGKLVNEVKLPLAITDAKTVTATEAGLPPEADQVLTADDTIFSVELQSGDDSKRHAVVVRKTPEGCQLLAIIRSAAP